LPKNGNLLFSSHPRANLRASFRLLSDAVEADAFDFPLWQVRAAACGVGPAEVAALDGRTRLPAAAAGAAGGGAGGASAAVANPTAVALTHVLHNKREFPFAAGAADLVVLSLGGSAAALLGAPRPPASFASPEPARPTW